MDTYDVIVIGARCAGASTALLLSRSGYRVLLVDKATFPSDTLSTHLVHPPGIAALGRWGVLDDIVATGCPPISEYAFDFGPLVLAGAPGTAESPVSYAPRRTVLDATLVAAACAAGADLREGCSVDDLVVEGGRVAGIEGRDRSGARTTARARVVVGADGRHSFVARTVDAPSYDRRPPLEAAYYTYWSGLPTDGRFEVYIRPRRGFAAIPTNDGLTLVVVGWPHAEFADFKHDVESNYPKVFAEVPSFADRIASAKREDRFYGTAVENYFRKPYGPGWVLVGDAGYNKDYITAMGITDAFLQAEACTAALRDAFEGRASFEDAMARFQRDRDEHAKPFYELTCQLAALEPPPPPMQQLFGAIAGNQQAMDGFARVNAGVTSPADFFSEANIATIFAQAATR